VIVRLVTAPPTAVKAHDPPEKVGHRGAKTALLLHHFGGVSSRCDGPELATPKATTAVEAAKVHNNNNNNNNDDDGDDNVNTTGRQLLQQQKTAAVRYRNKSKSQPLLPPPPPPPPPPPLPTTPTLGDHCPIAVARRRHTWNGPRRT